MSQFLKTKEEIDKWMSEQKHNGYTINDDLTVDIHEDFKLKSKIKLFTVQFGEVNGSFYCAFNNLTNLKGAPREVGGTFDCSFNNLTSLKGAPREVGENFYCFDNDLTSIKGAPREVGGNFNAHNNKFIEETDHSFIEIIRKFFDDNKYKYNGRYLC